MRELSINFPEFIDSELHKLCSEFIDIFALESEKIRANNFYKQRLGLKDNQPNYKNKTIEYHIHIKKKRISM